MKFRPLHDRVVVRRVEEDTKTAGGIIIPDTVKEKPMQGEIIAVGPGARDESGKLVPLDVKKGDKVLFGKWSGTEVKIDGQDLLIMKESDILGVIDGKVSVRAAGLIARAVARGVRPLSTAATSSRNVSKRGLTPSDDPSPRSSRQWQPKT
jgi:chaperonin GroES